MIVAENNTLELETVTLKEKVNTDTPLKKWLVEYAGRKFQTEINKLKVEKNEEVVWYDGGIHRSTFLDEF